MIMLSHVLTVLLFVSIHSTCSPTAADTLVACPKSCGRKLYSHCTRSGSAAVDAATSDPSDTPTNIAVVRSERNSGSNWLNDILMHNTHDLWYKGLEPMRGSCIVLQGTMGLFGWKHAHLTAETDEPFPPNMLLIVLVRDAIRWLVSMYHHPYTGKTEQGKWMGPGGLTFSQFLRTPVTQHCDSGLLSSKQGPYHAKYCKSHNNILEHAENFLETRTSKYQSYLNFEVPKKAVLRYEDAYADIHDSLGAILDRFAISHRSPIVPTTEKRLGVATHSEHHNMTVEEVITKVGFTAADLLFVNETLDWELEKQLGYADRYSEYFDAFERLHPGALATARSDDYDPNAEPPGMAALGWKRSRG